MEIEVVGLVFLMEEWLKGFGMMELWGGGMIRKYDVIGFVKFSMVVVGVKSVMRVVCGGGM